MARKAGVPIGQAISSLETASRLDELSEVDSALRSGKLSVFQANEVASAAAADPSSQKNLLVKAATENLTGLRDAARKVKAAADPDELASYRAIHRRRYLRHWADPDGAFRLDASLTADAGAKFLSSLDPFRNQVFKHARAAGTREPYDAYSADALVAMAESAGENSTGIGAGITRELKASTASSRQLSLSQDDEPHDGGSDLVDEQPTATAKSSTRSTGPRAVINVHVDHAALVRGRTEPGETCEIAGVGPVPVAVVQEMANDAFLKVLVTDGADIKAVAHAGRTIPARLRTALENRDPTCCVPGCNTTKGLEIDHLQPFAEGGPTTLENLARVCHWHHRQKTLGGWQLTGQPGDWTWLPPPDSS